MAWCTRHLSEDEWMHVVWEVATHPQGGDIVSGTGGVRKLRVGFPGRRGKSGGLRVFFLYLGDDRPLYAIAVLAKSERGNLDKRERNQLRELVRQIKGET